MGYLDVFAADADTTDVASALERSGAAVIESLVSPDTIDRVRVEIDEKVSPEDQQGSSAFWPNGNRTVGGLAAVSRTFVESMLTHPTVLAVVDQLLKPAKPMVLPAPKGDSPILLEELEDGGTQLVWTGRGEQHCHHYTLGACVMLEVGPGRTEHQTLHRENAIYQPYVGDLQVPEFIVSTMWTGTDFSTDNGATRLVPGSHRWPEDRLAKADEIVRAEAPKGSVVLWLSRTLHGAARTLTGEPRTGYFASYIADWFRQEENQYISVPAEVAATYSDVARQIIGYRSSDAVGWVKGRDRDNLLQAGQSGQL